MTRPLPIVIACLSLLVLGTLAVPEAKAFRVSNYQRSYSGSYRYSGYCYPGYCYPGYYPPTYCAPTYCARRLPTRR